MQQRGLKKLSTRGSQAVSQPSWKEEVNRRLAAHHSRKGLAVVEEDSAHQEQGGVSDRAAKAAARVAARFSSAPSYAEMQAAEARSALRDAEVATRAALEAQAAAHVALANLERFAEDQAEREHERLQQEAAEVRIESAAKPEMNVAGDRDFYTTAPETAPTARADEAPVAIQEYKPVSRPQEAMQARPIHANVIHFPRELVATRRIRPRLSGTEELSAEEQLGQLSIFEVDPNSIAIGPVGSVIDVAPAPSWSGPEWTAFELEPERVRTKEFDGEPPAIVSRIELAPLQLRCMAGLIDFSLIVGMVCAAGAGIAGHFQHAPAMKAAEAGVFGAVLLIGILYYTFFLLVAMSTPGMMYARIGLCTFDDEYPTRSQMRGRLGALLISVLPVGLGMAWAIFDEDHLSWHDRISRTYLRRC